MSSQREPLYSKDHNHILVYEFTHENGCDITTYYICQDKECGYWESTDFHNPSKCNLQVTRYSTRVTCYECSICGRSEQERS